MKLKTNLMAVEVVPSEELLTYDMDTVPWQNRPKTDIFHMAKSYTLIRTNFDLTGETSYADIGGDPINPLLYAEIKKLEAAYNAKAKIAVLLRLEPGGANVLHRDTSLIFQKCHRCHLPLRTKEGAYMELNGDRVHLSKGVWFEINNDVLHRAVNNSDDYRVHFVVDLLPNDA